MLHHFVPDSRFLSRLTLLLLVASPTSTAFALEEERRSTLHTYTLPSETIQAHSTALTAGT